MEGADGFRGGWPDEEELGRLAYSSPDPLMMLDDDGVILAVNPAWWDVLGLEPDDLLGYRFFDFIHTDDRQRTADRWQAVVAGYPVVDERNRWSTAADEWRWLSWSWKRNPATGHVFSAGRDVTSHMDLYLRVTEDRQLLATAETLANVGSWEWTSQPDVVSMSAHMRQLLGIADTELVTSHRALQTIRPDDRDRILGLLTMSIELGEKVDAEFRVVAADGVERVLVMHAEPSRDEAGMLRLHGAVQDVTAQRLLAVLKDAFLAAVSHELRTPLTIIKGVADTLVRLEETDEGKRRQLEESLVRNVARLGDLMTDLLDFGTLQHGDMQLRPRRFDLATLVHKLVAASPIAARITIDGPSSLSVDADPAIIERILHSLLDNAAKYAPTGPVTVSYQHQGGMLRLTVADVGPGVPAEEAERIFQPFHRVADEHPQPGTGIGLALVAEFARVHGGRAWVQPHQPGAEFIVEIRPTPGDRSRAGADGDPPVGDVYGERR